MDDGTQCWNQYNILRDEIKLADTQNYQILGVAIAASAAILNAGLDQTDSLIRYLVLLTVFVITAPAYQLLRGNRMRIWRISTYMRVFLEPKLPNIRWEMRLSRLAHPIPSRDKRGLIRRIFFTTRIITNEWLIISLLNFIAGVAAILVTLIQFQTDWVIKSLAISLVCVVTAFLLIVTSIQERELRRGGIVERENLRKWRLLKKGVRTGASQTGTRD
jgi:hypothetical protein